MIKVSSVFLALLLSNQSAFAAELNSLKAHRAVYDVKLLKAEERSGIKSMNGRIVYELEGNACEGMSVHFRFVSNIQTNGASFVTDQRTSTHESPDGSEFTFNTSSFVNEVQDQNVTGNAIRSDEGVRVTLGRNDKREIELEEAIFTTAQLIEVINAAKEGESFIKHDIFDGSGDGDYLLSSVSVIGRPKVITEVIEGEDEQTIQPLLSEVAWPVTMSYFEKRVTRSSEAMPLYEASFYLYENGITRQLKMRYLDYTLAANISNLEFLEQAPCTPSSR